MPSRTARIPPSLFFFDVCADRLIYAGENGCQSCLGGNGLDLAIAPDGSRLYVGFGRAGTRGPAARIVAPHGMAVLRSVGAERRQPDVARGER